MRTSGKGRWALVQVATVLALSWATGIGAADVPAAGLAVKPGDRIVIAGDSITEQKRYSRFIEDYLTVCVPELELWCVQIGWSGEKLPGLLQRMEWDVFGFQPNLVTICYGMNDGGYRAYDDKTGAAYRANLQAFLDRAQKSNVRVIVGSPGAVDTTTYGPRGGGAVVYNDTLAHLAQIAQEQAAAHGMPFANVHEPMMRAMAGAKAAYGEAYHLCGPDGVHPAGNGHVVMAYAFLRAMGLSGQIGTFTFDRQTGKGDVTAGHRIVAADAHGMEIESRRYPFCFSGDGKSPDSTLSILPYVPFNQELNRLTLVVKHPAAAKIAVTWGTSRKVFTGEQLAGGINLAAEFPANPFCDAFGKVDAAVTAKQGDETKLIKTYFATLADLQTSLAPEEAVANAVKLLREKVAAKCAAHHSLVTGAFRPITHRLSIEPVTAADN